MIIFNHTEMRGKNMSKYVIFRVENEKYGVYAENVEKILKLTNISKIPGFNHFVEGVINYQKEILPLISIKKLFNLQNQEISTSSSVVIIKGDKSKAGIIVDEVEDIEETNDDASCTKMQSQYLEEVIIMNGNIISILSSKIINAIE